MKTKEQQERDKRIEEGLKQLRERIALRRLLGRWI